jgi:hypothetical protein
MAVVTKNRNFFTGHLGFSIGPESNNTWLAACNDHS